MLQEKKKFHNFQINAFLIKGKHQINNDTKKKVKFDISFYFVETNHKSIFFKFFLR